MTYQIVGLQGFDNDIAAGVSEMHSSLYNAMRDATNTVKNHIQDITPYKTGTLRRSIQTQINDNGATGLVYNDPAQAPYGIYVEEGTSPHDIYPVSRQALFWKGALNPYAHVSHPGTQAHPFFFSGLDDVMDKITEIFAKVAQNVVTRVAGGHT